MAYGLLPRAERRRLHARVVQWLEDSERVEDILDMLAHHAVNAELHERGLHYLVRAAERARRAAAHREEAALLEQAIAIAQSSGRADLVPEYRARRGRALTRVTLWAEARRELEAALDGLPSNRRERRAEVLVDLALACNWTMDEAALLQRAAEALEVAAQVGRDDLRMGARFWLAWGTGSRGDVSSAIDRYESAVTDTTALGVAVPPSVLPLYTTTLCWAGRFPLAVERGREAVRIAREASDTDSTLLAMQVLGLALAGTGAYDEASQVFDDAIRFGREYGVGPFLARATAMSAGFHLDIFDFDGHSAIAEEARDLARSAGFQPPFVSASIDLLLNLIRRGEIGEAERLERELPASVEKVAAWHGWLWRLRFGQARAELSLARGDLESATELADSALEQARGRRPKYEALALVTRAEARRRLDRTADAIADLNEAVRVARLIADPALFLRAASAQLAIDGNDELAYEARATTGRILSRLPTEQMRKRFLSADAVRRVSSAAMSN